MPEEAIPYPATRINNSNVLNNGQVNAKPRYKTKTTPNTIKIIHLEEVFKISRK
jgi:hypothetical protein